MAERKTVVTKFRLSQTTLQSLQKEAREQKTSLNTLVNQIIAKHIEWDTFAHKYGFVNFPQDFYSGIILATDESQLTKAAVDAGRQLREYLLFSFGKANASTLVEALSFAGRYAGLGSIELKSAGPRYRLAIHHHLGRKHSIYLSKLLETAIPLVIGSRPTSEVGDELVMMEFDGALPQELASFPQPKSENEIRHF